MHKGVVIWNDVKFSKDVRTCSTFRNILSNIDMSIFKKEEDMETCLKNIAVAEVVGEESKAQNIFKRTSNIGLKIDPNQPGHKVYMRDRLGKSKEVIKGLLFMFPRGDKEVEVYLQYTDDIKFLSCVPEAI
jgi:hypothetical protein